MIKMVALQIPSWWKFHKVQYIHLFLNLKRGPTNTFSHHFVNSYSPNIRNGSIIQFILFHKLFNLFDLLSHCPVFLMSVIMLLHTYWSDQITNKVTIDVTKLPSLEDYIRQISRCILNETLSARCVTVHKLDRYKILGWICGRIVKYTIPMKLDVGDGFNFTV